MFFFLLLWNQESKHYHQSMLVSKTTPNDIKVQAGAHFCLAQAIGLHSQPQINVITQAEIALDLVSVASKNHFWMKDLTARTAILSCLLLVSKVESSTRKNSQTNTHLHPSNVFTRIAKALTLTATPSACSCPPFYPVIRWNMPPVACCGEAPFMKFWFAF